MRSPWGVIWPIAQCHRCFKGLVAYVAFFPNQSKIIQFLLWEKYRQSIAARHLRDWEHKLWAKMNSRYELIEKAELRFQSVCDGPFQTKNISYVTYFYCFYRQQSSQIKSRVIHINIVQYELYINILIRFSHDPIWWLNVCEKIKMLTKSSPQLLPAGEMPINNTKICCVRSSLLIIHTRNGVQMKEWMNENLCALCTANRREMNELNWCYSFASIYTHGVVLVIVHLIRNDLFDLVEGK